MVAAVGVGPCEWGRRVRNTIYTGGSGTSGGPHHPPRARLRRLAGAERRSSVGERGIGYFIMVTEKS
jgi:hypothetical protein